MDRPVRTLDSWSEYAEASPIATWLLDREGTVLLSNGPASRLTAEFSAAELGGWLQPETADGFEDRAVQLSDLRVELRFASWKVAEGIRVVQAFDQQPAIQKWNLQNFLRSSADQIELVAMDGRVLSASGAGQLGGRGGPDSTQGTDWISLWPGDQRQAAAAALEAGRTGAVGRFEREGVAANGDKQWWDVVVSPYKTPDGEIAGVLSVSRDVTKFKESHLCDSLEKEILESIAHNSPLSGILDAICKLGDLITLHTAKCAVLMPAPGTATDSLIVASAPSLSRLVGHRIACIAGKPDESEWLNLQRVAQASRVQHFPLLGPDGSFLGSLAFLGYGQQGDSESIDSRLHCLANLSAIALARDSHLRRLRTKQDRLQAISRAAPVGIYQVDAAGNWIYVNERFEKITGLAQPQCHGEGWLASVHPDDRGLVKAAWTETRARNGEFRAEYRLAAAGPETGAARWVLTSETPLGGDYLGATTEITGLKAAEAALTESSERFETLANNISQLCWIADSNGSLIWYNHRWYDYTGTTFEQMQGWGWTAVHHPDHVDRVVAKISRNWETGEEWEDTFPLRARDGEYRWFLSRAIPIRGADGRVVRWFGTNTDVTEQRQLEATLHRQNIALQRSNEDLSRFAFVASHDLQEPVRSVVTFAQLLQRSSAGSLDNKASGYLDAIIDAGIRMNHLIRDLLVYAQASTETEVTIEAVELSQVFAETLLAMRNSIEESGASIVCMDQLPRVYAVRGQVAQLLQNLLSNSIKYRRDGVAPEVRVSSFLEGDFWRIEIQDNGQGFPAEYAERIFEFLKRLHGRDVPGSGIGLALCKTIVERFGGSIGAKSVPGEGSVFWFTLPAQHAS